MKLEMVPTVTRYHKCYLPWPIPTAFDLIPPVRPTVQGGTLNVGAGADRLDYQVVEVAGE